MRNWINLVESSLMEGSSETLFRRHNGKFMEFADLPVSAQKAIHYYMTVDGDRPDYADELTFGYVVVPAEELKKVCWDAPDNEMRDDYPDWDAYHKSYWSGENDADYANHLEEMRPVLLDDGEGIHDGWHRLHWYLRNGVKNIPAVWLVSHVRNS